MRSIEPLGYWKRFNNAIEWAKGKLSIPYSFCGEWYKANAGVYFVFLFYSCTSLINKKLFVSFKKSSFNYQSFLIWQYPLLSTLFSCLPLFITFSGHNWTSICTSADSDIRTYSVSYDRIWMDRQQILLVSVHHVLHIVILHILRDVFRSHDTQSQHCGYNLCCILLHMESIFRLSYPTPGNYKLSSANVCWLFINL